MINGPRLRIGIIPSNGRECAANAVASLGPQVDLLAVIEAGPNVVHRDYDNVIYLHDDGTEMNISRWWNVGLDWARDTAEKLEQATWDVAIINDDVVVPPTWLCYIADDMRDLGCVAACSGGPGYNPIIQRHPGPVPLHTRMQGFAFVMAGESDLRPDERFRWYYSDDIMDWEARRLGGMVIFPGCHVEHWYPNGQVTPEINVYNSEDAEKFKQHWGMLPW